MSQKTLVFLHRDTWNKSKHEHKTNSLPCLKWPPVHSRVSTEKSAQGGSLCSSLHSFLLRKCLILPNLPWAAHWFLLYSALIFVAASLSSQRGWSRECLAWPWTIQMWAFGVVVFSQKEVELEISEIQILTREVIYCRTQFLSATYITLQHLSRCRFRKSFPLRAINLYNSSLLCGKYCTNDF